MICSNCGKNIPFIGNVCPYCHADKSADKDRLVRAVQISGMVLIVLAALIWTAFLLFHR